MKLPKNVPVMGEIIHVKAVKNWNGHKDVPGGLVGRFYPDSRKIYLNITYPENVVKRFLCHEINHAIMHITGIDQNMSLDLQEVIAQSFASFYMNKAVFK